MRLFLAGIDDAHYFRGDNIEKAAAGIPNEGFSILLSHTPEIYRQAAHAEFDLLLSGHTLGGQICLLGGTNPARFGSTSLYGIRRLNLSQHGRLHVRRCRIVCRCRVDQLEPGGQSSKSGARRTAERSSTRLYTQAADGVASEGASSFFCSPELLRCHLRAQARHDCGGPFLDFDLRIAPISSRLAITACSRGERLLSGPQPGLQLRLGQHARARQSLLREPGPLNQRS